MVGKWVRWTYNQTVVGSTLGRVAIKWLRAGKVNSASHPSGVGKSSTSWGIMRFATYSSAPFT